MECVVSSGVMISVVSLFFLPEEDTLFSQSTFSTVVAGMVWVT